MIPNGSTELLALFGRDISNSPSPATHSLWAELLKLNYLYLPLHCPDEESFHSLGSALMACKNFRGANITNPFKRVALSLPGVELDTTAARCGAANTLYRAETESGGLAWRLANTDLAGCSASIRKILSQQIEFTNKERKLIFITLGTGAMARTCSRAIEEFRTEFQIIQNTQLQRQLLEEDFDANQILEAQSADELILINTLPTGTSGEADQTALRALNKINQQTRHMRKHLFEVSYVNTRLSRQASSLRWNVIHGDLLFETQARESFKLWTDHSAPPNLATALRPFEG